MIMTQKSTGPAPIIPAPGRQSRSESIYLYPGKLYVSAKPVTISTILGSCVALGLWDEELGIGGMNHFMLPFGSEKSPRFAESALPMLLESLEDLGARKEHLQACLFGGSVLSERDHFQLGPRNLEVAWQFLDEQSISVRHEDCGGDRGRKILFNTGDGSVTVRRL